MIHYQCSMSASLIYTRLRLHKLPSLLHPSSSSLFSRRTIVFPRHPARPQKQLRYSHSTPSTSTKISPLVRNVCARHRKLHLERWLDAPVSYLDGLRRDRGKDLVRGRWRMLRTLGTRIRVGLGNFLCGFQ
jgi:hypothetical protein